MRPTLSRTRFVLLALLLAAAGCAGKKAAVAPRPVPRLTTPRIALTIARGGGAGIELLDPAGGGFTRLSPAGVERRRSGHLARRDASRLRHVDGQGAAPHDHGGGRDRPEAVRQRLDARRLGTSLVSRRPADRLHRDPRVHLGPDVYTILASGDSLNQVTNDGQSYGLDWSPDGTRILFVYRQSVFDSTRDYLRDVRLGISGVRTLLGPFRLPIAGADYSPDGTHITFCYAGVPDLGYKVEVCNADGSGRTTIADGNPPLEGLSAPSWSPDGSLILFSATSRPDRTIPTARPRRASAKPPSSWTRPSRCGSRAGVPSRERGPRLPRARADVERVE